MILFEHDFICSIFSLSIVFIGVYMMSFLTSTPVQIPPCARDKSQFWSFYRDAGADYLFSDTCSALIGSALIDRHEAKKNTFQEEKIISTSLDEFWKEVDHIEDIYDKMTAEHMVRSRGAMQPELLVIADAPMDAEDKKAEAFQSDAFKLIEKMVEKAGFDLAQCHFSHITFWRPAGNAQGTSLPHKNDMVRLAPYLKKHITLVQPQKVLLLGVSAIASFHHYKVNINEDHGKIYDFSYEGFSASFMHSYSVKAIHKQPIFKKKLWFDLLHLKQKHDA